MKLQDMLTAIEIGIDDTVDTPSAVLLLNEGKNQMATAASARFPDVIATNMDDLFVFDEEFHMGPVLFAIAKLRAGDDDRLAAGDALGEFVDMKKEFVENYKVPPRYKKDRFTQQFIATAAQSVFTITDPDYDPAYGDLKVYVNNLPRTDFTVNDDRTFTFGILTVLAAGDAVTAMWEEHHDLQEPPYKWWGW